MSRRDPRFALVRALVKSSPGAVLREIASRDWASATFVGARHALSLNLPDDAASRRWLADLPELEVTLSGHILADIVVDGTTCEAGVLVARIAALTLIDA